MKKLRKLFSALKIRYFGSKHEIVSLIWLGIKLTVIKGTLQVKPDQDDAWLFHLMGQFDNIFDIGANMGQSSLFAKIQGNNKRILLADPNPEALSLAAKNLILNNYSNRCEFIPAFVNDTNEDSVEFFTIGAGAAGSMYKGHAESAAAIGNSIMVPTTTIDSLVENVGWAPEFIKIDVEGAEAKVLQGANLLASKKEVWFMVEMHSPPELPMVENAQLVLKWASETGYDVWYMRDFTLLTHPEMIADRGKCHLLLLPKTTPYPNALRKIPQRSPLPDGI